MAKRYNESIEVTPDGGIEGPPLSFSWRGRRYVVDQQLASWREAGEWWNVRGAGNDAGNGASGGVGKRDSQMRARAYYRILARPSGALSTGEVDSEGFLCSAGAVYDIYLDQMRAEWHLARVWD